MNQASSNASITPDASRSGAVRFGVFTFDPRTRQVVTEDGQALHSYLSDSAGRQVLMGWYTPSIANFKPQLAWKSIRQWLEKMQLILAA